MTQTANRFFSDDEIEAVDMEIETLILSRKRQEVQQQAFDIISDITPIISQNRPTEVSRRSVAELRDTASSPEKPKVRSALPPHRLTGTAPSAKTFRIDNDGDNVIWPEAESAPRVRPAKKATRRRTLRVKWVIVLAIAITMWTAIIGGAYAAWQSNQLLAVARFIIELF
jgi:hypothetical protein